jgi:probable rRNA maturation factor
MTRRASGVEIVIEDAQWKTAGRGLPARIERIGTFALKRAKAKGTLTLLLSGDEQLRELNTLFRGKNKPTNVLSFPANKTEPGYLGDVAIAYGVTAREAAKTNKTVAEHTVHLAVHGILHLLGYDHEKPRPALIMERLEAEILAEFGVADPYALPQPKRKAKSAKRHVRS